MPEQADVDARRERLTLLKERHAILKAKAAQEQEAVARELQSLEEEVVERELLQLDDDLEIISLESTNDG